ncbi:MAG: response regulator [Planctomycetota bacterium]
MGKKILAADDERDIRIVVKAVLSKKGYEVHTASDGQEAIDRLSSEEFSLVILDVLMPKLNGFSVLQKIREQGKKELPVIMLTALSSDKDVWNGYEKGATYYLPKPFENKQLINIVDYLIGDLPEEERKKIETTL